VVQVVTDSPYAAGIAARMKFPVVRVRRGSTQAFLDERQPRLVVTDTFPNTLRGTFRHVHIARRLKAPFPMEPGSAQLSILAEPVSPEHESALRAAGACLALPGPIVLDVEPSSAETAPASVLVVHSGSRDEVQQLQALAKGQPHTVISPRFGVDTYPVSHLFAAASRIITGAGYNLMAELLPYRAKHTAIAFERKYDDQQARLDGFFSPGTPPATLEAATAIANLL